MATNPAGSGDAFRLREEAARSRELESDSPVAPCEKGAARRYDGPEHEMPVEEREAAECHPIRGGRGSGHRAHRGDGLRGDCRDREGCDDPEASPPVVPGEGMEGEEDGGEGHERGRRA